MTRPRRTLRRFLALDVDGVSAVEFAVWAPVLSLMLLAGTDITRYVIATERITNVAAVMGQMLAVNVSGNVNYVDLQFYHDSAMISYPQVLADANQQNVSWTNDMAITMTGVTFTATPPSCTSNCTYVPKVVWTWGTNPRSCSVAMTSSKDTDAPSSNTLPSDVFGATSLLVVDVTFTFRPLLASNYLPSLKIKRSFYVPPRYVASVGYQTISGDPGTTTVCP